MVQYDNDKCVCATIVSAYLIKKYKKSLYVTLLRVNRLANNPFNDFNNGFQMQLILYYEMRYRLDASKSKYRYYLLNNCLNSLLGSQIQEHRTVLSSYLKKISKAQKKVTLKKTSIFRCSDCDRYLFSNINVIRDQRYGFLECDRIFIEPRKWMIQSLVNAAQDPEESTVHELRCDNCDIRLGEFDIVRKFGCICLLHKNFEDYLAFKINKLCVKRVEKVDQIKSLFMRLWDTIDSWIESIQLRIETLGFGF